MARRESEAGAQPSGDGRAGDAITAGNSQPSTPKGRRTKAALIDSARTVFARDGFREARIVDIAEGAGVSHGSFYTYFPSKEAIFKEAIAAVVADILTALNIREPRESDPSVRIHDAIGRFLDAFRRNAPLIAALDQVASWDPSFRDLVFDVRLVLVDRAEQGLRRLQEVGVADSSLNPRLAAHALSGMIESYARTEAFLDERFDHDEGLETLSRLWTQAVRLVPVAAEPAAHGAAGTDPAAAS